jgi:hypothetical protein
VRRVLPQHVHDLAAIIDDLAQWYDLHSGDHDSGSSAM